MQNQHHRFFSFRKTQQNISKSQFIFPEPKLDLTDDDETLNETASTGTLKPSVHGVGAGTKTKTSPSSSRHKIQDAEFVEPKPFAPVSISLYLN